MKGITSFEDTIASVPVPTLPSSETANLNKQETPRWEGVRRRAFQQDRRKRAYITLSEFIPEGDRKAIARAHNIRDGGNFSDYDLNQDEVDSAPQDHHLQNP